MIGEKKGKKGWNRFYQKMTKGNPQMGAAHPILDRTLPNLSFRILCFLVDSTYFVLVLPRYQETWVLSPNLINYYMLIFHLGIKILRPTEQYMHISRVYISDLICWNHPCVSLSFFHSFIEKQRQNKR